MYIPILTNTIESGRWCKPPGLELVPCTQSFMRQVTYDDVPFELMLTAPGHVVSDSKVHDRTGYSKHIIGLMWDRYKEHLSGFRPSKTKKDMTKCYFILMFVWVHLKPNSKNISSMMWTEPTGFISEWVCILPVYHFVAIYDCLFVFTDVASSSQAYAEEDGLSDGRDPLGK